MSIYQVLDNAKQQIARGAASSSVLFKEAISTDDLEIRNLLGSSSNRDKAVGLRSLLTRVSEGADGHAFFADVVKNIYSTDLEIREMATSFLILYSQHEPELTLMIVNSVQRMLGDRSAIVRMQALRLASALRVPTVAPIVAHLITQVTNDISPLVRSACCQAIGKCYEIDPSLSSELLELLNVILRAPRQLRGDYEVAGWGLATLAEYWPQRLDLVHPFFRTYVRHIREFDEWCQVSVCRMLIKYCRHYLTGPEDADCKMLCEAVLPLLSSANSAVVVEAATTILYVGTPELFDSAHVAMRLLNLEPSPLKCAIIAKFCQARPQSFVPLRSDMILNLMPSDAPGIRHYVLKSVLVCRGPELSKAELAHLQFCASIWQNDQTAIRDAMEVITTLAGPSIVSKVIRWLVGLATDSRQSPELISESLMSLRVMVQQHKFNDMSATLATLAHLMTSEQLLPSAKATIIWLIGTHCTDHPAMATELLRQMIAKMASEVLVVRLQLLQLAAKLYTAFKNDESQFDPRVPALFEHAVHLGRYDSDVDVRDRARLFSALLSADNNSMATLLLQAYKPIPTIAETGPHEPEFVVDSASSALNKRLDGYTDLENWTNENVTDHLRAESLTEDISDKPEGDSNSSKGGQSISTKASSTLDEAKGEKGPKKMSLEEFLSTPQQAAGNAADSSGEESEDSEEESEEGSSAESGEDSEKEGVDKR